MSHNGGQHCNEIKIEELATSSFTASFLQRIKLPETQWLIPDLLPQGLTVLAGKPKVGKSWLALSLAIAVASGSYFWGEKIVTPGPVLYLALEDTPRRLKARLHRILGDKPAPEQLIFRVQFPQIDDIAAENIAYSLKENGYKFFIIDTLARIRPKTNSNYNAYAVDYADLSRLKKIADISGIGVLVVHHLKKAIEIDPLDMISGSTGLTGAADTLWVLNRQRTKADATLFVTGRDVESRELALEFNKNNCSWELIGDAEEARLSAARQEILQVLQEAGTPLSPKQLAELTGKPVNNIKKLVYSMNQDGQIKQLDRGLYFI